MSRFSNPGKDFIMVSHSRLVHSHLTTLHFHLPIVSPGHLVLLHRTSQLSVGCRGAATSNALLTRFPQAYIDPVTNVLA